MACCSASPVKAKREPKEHVLVYQTDVLTEDVTVAGPIWPSLSVSTTGTDQDASSKPPRISSLPQPIPHAL